MPTPGRPSDPASVHECLNRLGALLAAGPPRFPPGRRAAWHAEARRLIHQLQDALSADAHRAGTLEAEAEAVLCRAQDEARRIVVEAEDHARRALEDGTLARAAELQFQQIREQAVREADETRQAADMYALTVLERLEREVARILTTVQRGKAVLNERIGSKGTVAATAASRLDNTKMASV